MKNYLPLIFIILLLNSFQGRSQSLIADIPFHDGSTTELQSVTEGTAINATPSRDRLGAVDSAYSFNASNASINFGSTSSFDLRNAYSISLWFNAIGNESQSIISRGYADNGDYSIDLEAIDNKYFVRLYLEGVQYFTTQESLVSSGWNHLVITAETGANGIKLYINGNLTDSATASTDLVGSSSKNFIVGDNPDQSTANFKGTIDDIKIYDGVISSEEVSDLASTKALTFGTSKSGFGNALRFDGQDDYAILPAASTGGLSDFTFETWIFWRGGNTVEDQVIWSFGIGNDRIVFFVINDNFPELRIGSVNDLETLQSTQTLPEFSWQHLAVSFAGAGTTSEAKIYLNGLEVATAVLPISLTGVFNDPPAYQTFGLDRVFNSDIKFNGSLDESRLWEITRTAEEIDKYKSTTIKQSTPGLRFNYNFDASVGNGDNRSSTILEEVFGEYDGTLVSFELIGSNSNYINSNIGVGNVNINRLDKVFVLPGQKLVINGTGILSGISANKVFVGDESIPVLSATDRKIEIQIPEDFGKSGVLSVRVENDNGISQPFAINVLYEDDNYEYILEGKQISGDVLDALSMASGDMDGDGDIDIIQGYYDVYWSENLGDNQFAQKALISSDCICADMELYDFDNDGDLDIILAQGNGGKVSIVENKSNGIFANTALDVSEAGLFQLRGIEIIDANADGFNDVLVASDEGVALYENIGDNETFIKVVLKGGFRATGLAVFDLENDGDLDIITSINESSVLKYLVLINDGTGDYTEQVVIDENDDTEPAEYVVADFNGDGFEDFAVLHLDVSLLFLNNQGDKTFNVSDLGKPIAWGGAATDVEGDGDMDLFVGSRITDIGFLENDGSANFTYIKISDVLLDGLITVESADFDNDGDADLIASSSGDGLVQLFTHINVGKDIINFEVADQEEIFNFDEVARQLDILVPHEYNLEEVVPVLETSFRSKAYVAGVLQRSGESILNFTDTVTYEVVNENGDSQRWTVTLNPLPGIPEITEIDDFTQTAAEIEWSIPDYTDRVNLQLSTDDFETLVLDTILFGAEIVVDFLEPGTEYAARVKGLSDFGESEDFSEDVVFITIPPNPILNQPTEVTSTTAVINWEENRATDNYILDIARDSTFTEFANGFDNRSLNTLSETVFGLTPGTKYWVRVSANNNETIENGNSGFSEVRTFVTSLDAAPLAKNATSVSSTSFTANWDLVSGQNIDYVIEVADDIEFANIVKTDKVNAAASIEVSELADGVSHWYRVYATNANGRSPFSNIIFVGRPIQLSELSFTNEKSRENTEPVALRFTVRGGQDPYDVIFRYRGALATEWVEDSVQQVEGVFQYDIENSQFDDVGIEFEVVVNDGFNTLRSSRSFIYWNDAESELTSLDLVNEWQIFSIPYELSDNLIETIFDEMGPFEYNSEWRLVRFDGERYLDAGAGINRIEIGASYWFNTTQNVSIQIDNALVNTANSFTLPLNQGWNQIGNPYNVPISWNKVRLSNGVASSVEQVNLFNRQSMQFVEGDIIEAFSGGFVWSDIAQAVEISLRDDNAASRKLNQESILGEDIDQESWLFELIMTSSKGDTLSAPIGIGIHPDAESGKDEFDKMRLPRFIEYTDIATLHPDYFYPYFSRDIQGNESSGSWLFTLSSNRISGPVTLQWNSDKLLAANRQLWLIDEETGRLINLADQNSVEIQYKDNHQLSLHYTENRNEKPLPFTIQMGNPYPNPTVDLNKVQVLLPKADKAYNLRLELIDLNGKRISTIAQGEYKAGAYTFETNLAKVDPFGANVYFYRLSVNGRSMVKRLILNR